MTNIALGETTHYTGASTIVSVSDLIDIPYTHGLPNLIDGTYKAYVTTNDTLGLFGNYSKYFLIDMGTSRKVLSVFVANVAKEDI